MRDNEGGTHPASDVAREFWRLMSTNDFESVGQVLAPGFVLEWPQSKERIRGAGRFAQMNSEYPAHGPWRFTLNRIVGGKSEAVSGVSVTDGTQIAVRCCSASELDHDPRSLLACLVGEPGRPRGSTSRAGEPAQTGSR